MSSQRSTHSDTSGALLPAIILFGGMTLLLVGLLASRPALAPASTSRTTAPSVAEATVSAEATEASQTVAVAIDPAKVRAGENSFQTTCSACHGFNAMGIPGLGKSLIGSTFVNSQTDDQLLAFLQVGRPVTDPLNTTGVQMPARGGNPNFTDDKLVEIIAYIRSLDAAASQAASGAAPTAAPTTSVPVATDVPGTFVGPDLSALAAPTSISGGDTGTGAAQSTAVPAEATSNAPVATSASSGFALPDLSGLPVPTSLPADQTGSIEITVEAAPLTEVTPESTVVATADSSASASSGEALYVQSCSGCHAADGSGVQYIAKPLAESTLLQAKDDAALLNFLINGDPSMTIPHPYRGGFPELSDADLQSIIVYLHSLPVGK